MVSEDSTSNPNSSILHQFIISNTISASQNQFASEHFDAYTTDLSGTCAYNSPGSVPGLQSLSERIPRGIDLLHAPQMADESDIGHRHLMDLLGAQNEPNYHSQRLSLSLGTCTTLVSPVQGRQRSLNSTFINPGYIIRGENAREVCNPRSECLTSSYSYGGNVFTSSSTTPSRSCNTSYGTEFLAVAIGNSKYLKPAQSLLDEMVKVSGKAIDLSNEKYAKRLSRNSKTGSLKLRSELTMEFAANNEGCTEKHELETQVLKLIALLEEVERRYERYYNHIDELISSFEAIAGLGIGKSYTALALQAMCRHFCSLRDAILSQICASKQKISPEMPKISAGISQLSLLDRETRQNRLSLQQLGMIQSSRQAWRPIRGLPETSVAILRAWLFEHFLHPYPNDSEKLMLASQTGLTKNQVSNWFINARVRLWKPMIEEMYKEEFAESSLESNPTLSQEGFADSAED